MSVCRQVGKTYLVAGMVFGLCVNRPGTLVIWSSHHGKTHAETFLAMQEFAKRSRVAPYISAVYVGSGDEEIRFVNGSRILFGARERGFGRGIPGVDVIVSDEAQIMSEKAVDAQLATMNTSQFGLALYLGTPPAPGDPSDAFTRMRDEAWAGTLEDAVWIEIGAEPGTDPNDRRLWSKWNPSHPKRTPVESILRLQRKLSADSFVREGMGTWDEGRAGALPGWAACAVESGKMPKRGIALGLAVSLDREWSSVGVAAPWVDGRLLVGANLRQQGTDWLPKYAAKMQKRLRCPVVIDGRGPGSALIPDLEAAGVALTIAKTNDVLDACVGLYDRVQQRVVAHMSFSELDDAVAGAQRRDVGDTGRWAWGRKSAGSDVSMLEAVTLAAWQVWNTPDYDIRDSFL
jgi:hypothetical protein